MDKKKVIEIVLKVLIYALGLIAAALGVNALASCTSTHNVAASGTTTIVTTDTTIVKHDGYIRSKNYPYEFKN